MATVRLRRIPAAKFRVPELLWDDFANFLADGPSPGEFLKFRFSKKAQRRASALLAKVKDGEATFDEEDEIDEFIHINALVNLVKARIRASKSGVQ